MDGKLRRPADFLRSTPYGFLVAVLAVTAPGRAQDDGQAEDTAAVRRLAVDGVKLAESGHCAEAIDKLARAEKLRHSPIVLERLGECQVAVGKFVEGSESLRSVLRDEPPANASAALSKALSRAESTLAVAKTKIAWLTITVAPDVADGQVSVDGRPISSALLGDERPANPGEHLIEASATGFFKASSSVTLGEGEKRAVSLQLVLDPNADAAPASKARPSAGPAPASRSSGTLAPAATAASGSAPKRAPNRNAAYVTWVVAGLAAGTGVTLGILAWQGKRDLARDCPDQACPSGSLSKLDQSRRFGNVSTGAFAVAGAGVVLGAILYATASSTSAGSGARADALSGASVGGGFRLHGFVGLQQAGIRGEF